MRKYRLSVRGGLTRWCWMGNSFTGGTKSCRSDTDEGGGSSVGLAEERSLSEGPGTWPLRLNTPSRPPGRGWGWRFGH